MEMPKLTDAHRKLEKLVGNWAGKETIKPSPFDPVGGAAVGRVDNRRALDGFAVVQNYEQERGGKVSFRGHGVFSWSVPENCYVLHWFDSMGFPVTEMKGQFEGDVLVLTSHSVMGHSRATFDVAKPGRYAFRMDMSQDGQQWMTFMDGEYAIAAKKSAKSPAAATSKKSAKPKKRAKPKRAAKAPKATKKSKKPARKGGARRK